MSKAAEKKKEEEEVEGEGEEEEEFVKKPETFEEYEQLVKNAKKKMIVLYTTSKFCSPCVAYKDKFNEFAKKYFKTVFVEVDLDNKFFFALFKEFRITCVPSFTFVKEGRMSQTLVGSDSRVLERKIRQELGIKDSQWAGLDVKWEYAPEKDEEEEEKKKKEEEKKEGKEGGGDVKKTEEAEKKPEVAKPTPQAVVRIERKMVKGSNSSLSQRKRTTVDPTKSKTGGAEHSKRKGSSVVRSGSNNDTGGVVVKFGGSREKGNKRWVMGADGKAKPSDK